MFYVSDLPTVSTTSIKTNQMVKDRLDQGFIYVFTHEWFSKFLQVYNGFKLKLSPEEWTPATGRSKGPAGLVTSCPYSWSKLYLPYIWQLVGFQNIFFCMLFFWNWVHPLPPLPKPPPQLPTPTQRWGLQIVCPGSTYGTADQPIWLSFCLYIFKKMLLSATWRLCYQIPIGTSIWVSNTTTKVNKQLLWD